MPAMKGSGRGFYDCLKAQKRSFDIALVSNQLSKIDRNRVTRLSKSLAKYLTDNVPKAIDKRTGLGDYRTNPYVLIACASMMDLSNPKQFARFLFDNKLYMGLETSFGKSIEEALVGEYPQEGTASGRWVSPVEKVAESKALQGLGREEKAQRRTVSVWREIDKSCVVGNHRYLVSIKSGPNCINDTQVEAMKSAIVNNHMTWMKESAVNHPGVENLDIVVGLTYGTDKTTNNKENQILVKLLEHGFEEEDRINKPGVLVDSGTRSIRVYRRIGQEFWSFMGNPHEPSKASFVYLEVLLALSKAMSESIKAMSFEDRITLKLSQLSDALSKLVFPRNSLPEWIGKDFSEDELVWLATAMTAFFDEGI